MTATADPPAATAIVTAADVTVISAEDAALHQAVVAARDNIAQSVWQFGAALKAMRDSGAYRAYGPETFRQYCESGDVGVSYRTALRAIGIHDAFANVGELVAGVSASGLDILARLIEPGDDPEAIAAIVGEARGMPVRQLEAAVHHAVETRNADPDRALPTTLHPTTEPTSGAEPSAPEPSATAVDGPQSAPAPPQATAAPRPSTASITASTTGLSVRGTRSRRSRASVNPTTPATAPTATNNASAATTEPGAAPTRRTPMTPEERRARERQRRAERQAAEQAAARAEHEALLARVASSSPLARAMVVLDPQWGLRRWQQLHDDQPATSPEQRDRREQ